jgi:hypothetical protein
MHETGERWKNVSMELRCVQSMLEEVVAYWRRWNTLADEFESWLDRAYGLLDLPEEDKMEYFQVISGVKFCINLTVKVIFLHNFENVVNKKKSKIWFDELASIFVCPQEISNFNFLTPSKFRIRADLFRFCSDCSFSDCLCSRFLVTNHNLNLY